jgi:hypothetical protein
MRPGSRGATRPGGRHHTALRAAGIGRRLHAAARVCVRPRPRVSARLYVSICVRACLCLSARVCARTAYRRRRRRLGPASPHTHAAATRQHAPLRPHPTRRPIRVTPSESLHPSQSIRVTPSESLYPSHSIRVTSSESIHPSLFIRVSPSESARLLASALLSFRNHEQPVIRSPAGQRT